MAECKLELNTEKTKIVYCKDDRRSGEYPAVKFDFLGSMTRRQDTFGTVVEDWAGEIEEITTLETNLEGEAGTVLPVTLSIHATALGTLEVWCVSKQDDRKFRLEFNVRERDFGAG